MAGGTLLCGIGQDDHLSFAVPNLAGDFVSYAPRAWSPLSALSQNRGT